MIDREHKYYQNRPGAYISHLFGHEGENSLLSLLLQQGLALELVSSMSDVMDLFSLFQITIKLTEKGFEKYVDVCNYAFCYLKMLQQKGVQQYIFDEIKQMNSIFFEFKSNENQLSYANMLGRSLQSYPLEHILVHGYLQEKFDPELIQKTINGLQLDNMRIYLVSKKVEPDCTQLEPLYQQKYQDDPLPEQIRKLFQDPEPLVGAEQLNVPPKNPFLPKNFDLLSGPELNHTLP